MKMHYFLGLLAGGIILAGCGSQTSGAPVSPTSSRPSLPTSHSSSPLRSQSVPRAPAVQPPKSSSVASNPLPPSQAQISATLAHYPAPWDSSAPGFIATRTLEFANGQGGSLTVVLGEWAASADGGQNLIFVWNNQQFLGVTTTQWSFDPTISAIPNGFMVTYYQWAASTPFAEWGPNTASNSMTVRYTWTGTSLVPSFTGAILQP